MSKPHIGIVISTTREGRFGDEPAAWIRDLAAARGDLEVEIIDLRDYPMPFFDEPASPLYVPPQNEAARRWGQKVAELDGFIFVTAEYNRGVPAALKNALDYAYREFNRKPAAYVGYGGVGGARGGAVATDQRRAADGTDSIGRAYRRSGFLRHADAGQDLCRHAAPGTYRRHYAGRADLVGPRAEERT